MSGHDSTYVEGRGIFEIRTYALAHTLSNTCACTHTQTLCKYTGTRHGGLLANPGVHMAKAELGALETASATRLRC